MSCPHAASAKEAETDDAADASREAYESISSGSWAPSQALRNAEAFKERRRIHLQNPLKSYIIQLITMNPHLNAPPRTPVPEVMAWARSWPHHRTTCMLSLPPQYSRVTQPALARPHHCRQGS
jgi:hypothetical protein